MPLWKRLRKEDTIDIHVTRQATAKNKGRSWLQKAFTTKDNPFLEKEIKSLRECELKDLVTMFRGVSLPAEHDILVADARNMRPLTREHTVGFVAETMEFVDRLVGESDELLITSIVGMAGLGKSTFAWKIFKHPTIQFEFPTRIWVNVSERFDKKNVLLHILSKFPKAATIDEYATEEDLAREVKSRLQEKKFLIVIDDIWTMDAWKKIKSLLPMDNIWGRVLVTTRNIDVGNDASTHLPYRLRLLSREESWELLQYQVFGKLHCVDEDLGNIGKDIAESCEGLPISIQIIGGILVDRTSLYVNNCLSKYEWEHVSTNVKRFLVDEDQRGLLGSIISRSYDTLPYKLRNCFLYLGVFPEDDKIPVKKLIRLWIAEGFIQETRGMRLEEVAHNNLKELISQNLVTVDKANDDGEPRICTIHTSVREICKRDGKELNLFQVITYNDMTIAKEENNRRLCLHSHVDVFLSEQQKFPKVRSLLCFNDSPMILETKHMAYVTDKFVLLRVYDAINIQFLKFPTKFVQQLHHLRYLTLVVADVGFKTLPAIVTNLWNLQTLIVDTPSPTLEVIGDIWKMRQLRHFESKSSIIFKKIGEGGGNQNLQTLSGLSPESCTDHVFRKSTSLITLRIQGDLRKLGDSKCLGELDSLNKLKLVHQVSSGNAAENPLKSLLDSQDFPPKIRILVLSGTRLDWTMMSIFSAIRSLDVLKLKENAFQGGTWKAEGSGFVELVCLHIENTDLKRWEVSHEHFPELKFLYINNCKELTEIPSTLGKSLDFLSLKGVTENATIHAEKLVEEQKKHGRIIRLNCAPSDETGSNSNILHAGLEILDAVQ